MTGPTSHRQGATDEISVYSGPLGRVVKSGKFNVLGLTGSSHTIRKVWRGDREADPDASLGQRVIFLILVLAMIGIPVMWVIGGPATETATIKFVVGVVIAVLLVMQMRSHRKQSEEDETSTNITILARRSAFAWGTPHHVTMNQHSPPVNLDLLLDQHGRVTCTFVGLPDGERQSLYHAFYALMPVMTD